MCAPSEHQTVVLGFKPKCPVRYAGIGPALALPSARYTLRSLILSLSAIARRVMPSILSRWASARLPGLLNAEDQTSFPCCPRSSSKLSAAKRPAIARG